jgi:hypothetical protein
MKTFLAITIVAALMNALFINCGDSNLSSLSEEASQGSLSESAMNGQSLHPSSNGSIDSMKSKVAIEIASTQTTTSDCSSETSLIEVQVKNAKNDFWACLEHKLDVPKTSKRYGEVSSCDHPSKFVSLAKHQDYIFDEIKSVWKLKSGHIKTRGDLFVPGYYRMLVLDSQNQSYASRWFYLGRPGYANCSATASQSAPVGSQPVFGPGTTCNWQIQNPKFVIGGGPTALLPSDVCDSAKIGTIAYGRWSTGGQSEYYYRCECP